jgi:hypothetical protein
MSSNNDRPGIFIGPQDAAFLIFQCLPQMRSQKIPSEMLPAVVIEKLFGIGSFCYDRERAVLLDRGKQRSG